MAQDQDNKSESSQRQMPYSLFTICTAMTSTLELDALLDLILDLTLEQLAAQRGSVLVYDKENDSLKMLASRGMPEEVVHRGYIPRKGSIAEWVMENNEPILLNDDVSDRRFTSISEKQLRSSMCVPMRSKGHVIGTLNLTRLQGYHFVQDDLDALVILATQAAVAIENARLIRENLESARLAAIGQTVSGISHCVKNMLTSLKGGMSLGEMAIKQGDWRIMQSGWKMLSRSVNRISLLVLDMLDYSKERQPLRRGCDPRELIEDVIASIEYEAEKHHVAIVRELPDGLPRVTIDGDQVFRCVLNLATNALEAIGEAEGQITIGARLLAAGDPAVPPAPQDLEDGEVCAIVLRVTDNGCGIPPEQQKEIFKPFFSTKGSKGTGIGLAVTQKIVREHGGRVELESAPAQGATFTLVIPCHVEK